MNIVTFSTYRTAKLQHGGQIRLNALHDMLRRDGFNLKHVSVHTGEADNLRDDEISILLDLPMQIYYNENRLRTDVNACLVFERDPAHYKFVENALNAFRPDVVWLEQPWLWPVVKRYLQGNDLSHVTVIYGSQNVEFRLIESVTADWDLDTRARLRKVVEDLETDLCRHASGIVAVSASDAEYFTTFGRPVLVARNGVSPAARPGGFDYWSATIRRSSIALFVGSAHPPNAEGFSMMLGHDLSFLAPNEKIAVIGGVCHLLRQAPELRRNRGLVFPRLLLLDNQDAGGVATFFVLARAIILPIVSGGGTNLKTAEALHSRKPIVATTRAFRGYEAYANFPNVHISDDPEQFRSLIRRQLCNEPPNTITTSENAEALDDLMWSRTLATVGRWTRRMVADTSSVERRSETLQPRIDEHRSNDKTLTAEGSGLQPMLHAGWHDYEEQGTWSKDPTAVLKISNPFQAETMTVSLELEVLVPPGGQNVVNIYTASSRHLSKICDSNSRKFAFTFSAKADDCGSDKSLEVYIQVQKLIAPISKFKEKPEDTRLLGCCLRSVKLNQNHEHKSSRQIVVHKTHASFRGLLKFFR